MVLDDIFNPGPAPKQETQVTRSSIRSSSAVTSLESELASPLDRGAAVVADFVLFFPIMALIIAPFRKQALEAQILGNEAAWSAAAFFAVGAAFLSHVLYQTFFISYYGATPGKKFMGIQVVSAWTRAKPNGLEAFQRALVWSLECLLLGVPWLSIYSTEKRRPFHDRIADTVVVVSKGKRAAAGSPTLAHMSIASGFQASCLTMLLAVIALQIFNPEYSSEEKRIAKLEKTGELCSEISEAETDWIQKAGKGAQKSPPSPVSRIELALALHGGEALDEDCLKKEADFVLWNEHAKSVTQNQTESLNPRTLAYFAKALVSRESENLSHQYFKEACPQSEAQSLSCRAFALRYPVTDFDKSKADDSFSSDDETDSELKKTEWADHEAEVENLLAQISIESPIYLKLWALQIAMEQKRFVPALTIAEWIPAHRKTGAYLAQEKAKANWLIGKRSDARLMMQSSSDLMPASARVEIARWFCANEIIESSCQAQVHPSCAMLRDTIERSPRWLSNIEVAASYIRHEICSNQLTAQRAKELEAQISNESAKKFLRAVALVEVGEPGPDTTKSNERETGLQALKELAESKNPNGVFSIEANIQLAELADSLEELKPVQARWLKLDTASSGWKQLGFMMMQKMSALRAWDEALSIGFKMIESEKHDSWLYKSMTVLAFRAGHMNMALGLMENVARLQPLSASTEFTRFPSSAPRAKTEKPLAAEFDEVVQRLYEGQIEGASEKSAKTEKQEQQ